MQDTRPLWMQLATLREDACISAHYSLSVIEHMRQWLQAIEDSSAAEGYPLTLTFVAIDQLEEEAQAAHEAIESGEWMPDPATD